MIPRFDENGQLPPGIHDVSWAEFVERYGTNDRRRELITGLQELVLHLKAVGCNSILIDGSFTTNKRVPGDYDACWDSTGVKAEIIDPLLLCFTDLCKEQMKEKYGGDIRIQSFSPLESDSVYFDYFQTDRNGKPKGIVRLKLKDLSL